MKNIVFAIMLILLLFMPGCKNKSTEDTSKLTTANENVANTEVVKGSEQQIKVFIPTPVGNDQNGTSKKVIPTDIPKERPQNKDKTVSNSTQKANLKNIKKSEYKWLKFSLDKYDEEKDIVKEYFKEATEKIEQGLYGTNDKVEIAISKEDINKDGVLDILAIIINPYFGGYNTNSLMCVFIEDKGQTRYIPISQAFIRIDNLSDQKEIGIVDDEKSLWKRIRINERDYIWDGSGYIGTQES